MVASVVKLLWMNTGLIPNTPPENGAPAVGPRPCDNCDLVGL